MNQPFPAGTDLAGNKFSTLTNRAAAHDLDRWLEALLEKDPSICYLFVHAASSRHPVMTSSSTSTDHPPSPRDGGIPSYAKRRLVSRGAAREGRPLLEAPQLVSLPRNVNCVATPRLPCQFLLPRSSSGCKLRGVPN